MTNTFIGTIAFGVDSKKVHISPNGARVSKTLWNLGFDPFTSVNNVINKGTDNFGKATVWARVFVEWRDGQAVEKFGVKHNENGEIDVHETFSDCNNLETANRKMFHMFIDFCSFFTKKMMEEAEAQVETA
jgi:hypothetical protein